MSDASTEYWTETISCAFDECDAWETWKSLTDEQKTQIVRAVEISHENYGMAFYSPPASDRINAVEREWKTKYEALGRRFEGYRKDAETAIKQALRVHRDDSVSIHEYGEVLRHSGRTERIQ